jgi:hypothetical protein
LTCLGGAVAVSSMILAYAAPVPAQAATPLYYQGHLYPSTAKAATADKPQSKVWFNDHAWWSLMVTPAGTVNIYKLRSDHTWLDTGTVVDSRASSTGDALWSGSKLNVISRTADTTSGSIRHYRFAYSGGVYTKELATAFEGGGSESATIDQDTTGRLWATFSRENAVYVTHSTPDQTTWTAPFQIPGADTAVHPDDISALVAFNGKVGVMWSDQGAQALRFAYHVDGAPDDVWAKGTVLLGKGKADDHINIKSMVGDSAGRVYAAIKTNRTVSTDPIIVVVTRSANGTWTVAPTASVADKLTRPQLALDSTNKVIYVMQATEGGGTIYYKKAPMSSKPAFTASGKGTVFMAHAGAKINNVSTSKDPINTTTGLVALGADEYAHRYYHTELAIPGGPDRTAPAAPSVTPAAGSYSTVQTVKMSAAESGATIRYTVGTGTNAPADPTVTTGTVYNGPILASTSEIIKARAYDAAGNASPVTRRDYTITSGSITTMTLSPDADTTLKQATPTTSYGSTTTLMADTQEVAGDSNTAIHGYLRFTIPALAPGQSIIAANLSVKASNGSTNGPAVYKTANTWDETTTWSAGLPARTSGVIGNYDSVGTTRTGVSLSGITEAGTLSLELAPETSDGVAIASRESAIIEDRPQLTLTISG